MSRKYKFNNPEGMYFISFAVIQWIDVFIREVYYELVVESLNYCSSEKGMMIFAYCIMPSHIHLVFKDRNNNPSKLIKEFKTYTSKQLRKSIANNPKESRKEWMLMMMKQAGHKRSNVVEYQFWQQNNHPIELWSSLVIDQKIEYIHRNPVVSGFVREAVDWKYSSAFDYSGGIGEIKIEHVDGR